jgi:hypothetical protein
VDVSPDGRIKLSQDFRPRAVETGYRRLVVIIMSYNNSEMKAYLRNEWKNDKSWMTKRPVCCPNVEDGFVAYVVAKFRNMVMTMKKTCVELTCCR